MCKVREEPAPCLITAQGATGCDGVWQCVAGRLSDKVLAPRSTVGATPETIKLMVRWASDEALQIYARINVGVDAALRASATTAQIHSVRSSTMAAAPAPEWAEQPDAVELHRRAE